MSKGIFVTATGTDVGKTYVTALMVKKLKEDGYKAGYYKAALSDARRTDKGLIPGDAEYVSKITGLSDEPRKMVTYIYEHAVSPHLAARIEGNPVEKEAVLRDYLTARETCDYITVEGSGGIVCPIRYDEEEHIFLEDIVKLLELDCIIVADAGLGTINSVVLTVTYMRQKGMTIKGILFNHFHPGDVMEEDNWKMIEEITGIPVVGWVGDHDEELHMTGVALEELYS